MRLYGLVCNESPPHTLSTLSPQTKRCKPHTILLLFSWQVFGRTTFSWFQQTRQKKKKHPSQAQTRPDQMRPDQIKPNQPNPEQTRPDQIRSKQTRPAQSTPDQTRPDETRPDQTIPDQIKNRPDQMKPDQIKSNQTRPLHLGHVMLRAQSRRLHAVLLPLMRKKFHSDIFFRPVSLSKIFPSRF